MSGLFGVLPVAGSGLAVDQTWLDTVGGNLANANDQVPGGRATYRPQYVDAAPTSSGGVHVAGIALGSAKGVLEYDPSNPKANAKGYIAVPAVDAATEMVGLVEAQTNYQANASVISHAVAAYNAVLAIKA